MIAEFGAGRDDALAAAHLFADGYIAETPALTAARARGVELGSHEPTANVGAFLRWLISVNGAANVVEVGTGAGVGVLWMADAISRTVWSGSTAPRTS